MNEQITKADHLLLTALRSVRSASGPCPCLFRLYGDHFKRDAGTLLGSIFAFEQLLRLMPNHQVHLHPVDSTVQSSDEMTIIYCMSCTQSNDQMQTCDQFRRHFNVTLPQMLSDLFEDIALMFEHHNMAFSSTLPPLKIASVVHLSETIH
ncbi:MAG: hypothetical protein AAF583_02345 [Pseudomonadota bacterium]